MTGKEFGNNRTNNNGPEAMVWLEFFLGEAQMLY